MQFARLVYHEKVGAASRLLSDTTKSRVLSLGDDAGNGRSVKDALKDKHPVPRPADPSTLIEGDFVPPDPILFDAITPALIRRVGLQVMGAAGPSGLDSEAWRRMISVYKRASNSLCSALADAAKRLCTEEVQSDHLTALLAGRLIPLSKNPSGVRPIAIGEVHRRIISKAVMTTIQRDVTAVTVPYQLCVGVPSACEVAVRALSQIFEKEEAEAILHQIEELKKSEKSIMPENLHHITGQKGLIDIVEYMTTLKKK